MATPRRPLGDSHNFGRRVQLRGARVHKPRSVFWEWLVLSRDSPLRQLLGEMFDFLPTLKFFDAEAGVGGEVERVKLEPLSARSRVRKRELAGIVGRSLALWSWLGVADLHWENLVLGEDRKGRIVFGPLDVEMMLADLALPTETKLLPDPDPEYAVVCQHSAGVRRVLPYLGKPISVEDLLTMAAQYRDALGFLEQHRAAIAEILRSLPLADEPLRVLLRGTGEYVTPPEQLWPPLLVAEREQLDRGDIPYFFRLYGRRGIHYFADPSLAQVRRLPLRGDVPQLDPLLEPRRELRSPGRETLRQEGLLALFGAFDHPSFSGRQRHAGLEVTFGARRLRIALPDGTKLAAARDLRALVSSVYLPCRCGEVRTVFVPPVTKCAAPNGNV
jgi:hypothetical protein